MNHQTTPGPPFSTGGRVSEITPSIRVTLLDRVTLTGPAGPADPDLLSGPQPEAVFAHLVLEREAAVAVTRLIDVIWEPEPPATWRSALRTLVARVRAFIQSAAPAAALESCPGGYLLRLPGPVEVDLEVALSSARLAEEALEAKLPDKAIAHATRAHAMSNRSFLPRGCGTWVEQTQAQLAAIRQRTLHVFGEAHLLRGEYARAARTAEEAIALAPLNEANHRLAMRALAAAGETGEAAMAFERCRRFLGEELGVGPSRQTTDLLGEILRS